MEKVDIKSMDITELQELLRELGEPKFRAKQLFDWLHAKQVDSFAGLTARENIFLRFRMARLSKVY